MSQYLKFSIPVLIQRLNSDTSFAISSTSLEQAVCMYITPTSVQAKSVQSVLIRKVGKMNLTKVSPELKELGS